MVVETIKENLCINKLVATKKELIMVEGDVIVPDSKPDILNTINTSGCICIYKKEILDERIRIDGNINTYIMYMADDSNDKVRGITTNLDFSENIQVSGAREGLTCKLTTKIKSLEAKVINGRKVGIKAGVEVEVRLYSNEEVEIVNDIPNSNDIKMLKKDLTVNSLVGMGETKIYAKETIKIDSVDNLAEILKMGLAIVDKDIKISYNKVLTKSEAEIKIMYLTEDNRVNTVNARIPVVGFIDVENVTEQNICDVDYEMKNMVIKPNGVEEHSIYIELEVGVTVSVFEEKPINLIEDLYSPSENIEIARKRIMAVTNKRNLKEVKQIREKVMVEGIENKNVVSIDINPIIENEVKSANRIVYEGTLELNVIVSNSDLQIETRTAKIPFDYSISDLEDAEKFNNNIDIEVANQDFVVQDTGVISVNVDLNINSDSYRSSNLDIIDEIQSNGEREDDDYNIIMYVVKRGDSLWKIAKTFGSTVEDIAKVNGIEDENKINIGQKLFIPKYRRVPVFENV